jgi:hypothetical protein
MIIEDDDYDTVEQLEEFDTLYKKYITRKDFPHTYDYWFDDVPVAL